MLISIVFALVDFLQNYNIVFVYVYSQFYVA